MAKSSNNKSAKQASTTFHNIMAASVKGNPKPQKSGKGMEVKEGYHLPFDSEFDWRTTLFHSLKESYIKAISEEITAYSADSHDYDWDDEEGVLRLCINDNLLKKIHDKVATEIEKRLAGE